MLLIVLLFVLVIGETHSRPFRRDVSSNSEPIAWSSCPLRTTLTPPFRDIFFYTKSPIYLRPDTILNPGSLKPGEVVSECGYVLEPLFHVMKDNYAYHGLTDQQIRDAGFDEYHIHVFVKRYRFGAPPGESVLTVTPTPTPTPTPTSTSATPNSRSLASNIVWIFSERPGSASDKVETLALQLGVELNQDTTHTRTTTTTPFDDFDVYIVDHRGTGRSHRLGCPRSGAEEEGSLSGIEIVAAELSGCRDDLMSYCLKNPNFTEGWSTSQAALDIVEIVGRVNQEYEDVGLTSPKHHLVGVGYGGFVASRIIQVEPDMFQTVVLDSIYAQGGGDGDGDGDGVSGENGSGEDDRYRVDRLNYDVDLVGKILMEKCVNDSMCLTQLSLTHRELSLGIVGANKFVRKLSDLLFPNATRSVCPKAEETFIDPTTLKRVLGAMLTHTYFRELIPSLFYRLLRCKQYDDYGVFDHIRSQLEKTTELVLDRVPYDSVIEGLHLTVNEFFTYPLPPHFHDVLSLSLNSTQFALLDPDIADHVLTWPLYPKVPSLFNHAFSTNTTHVLLLAGELDPITPLKYSRAQLRAIEAIPPATKHLVEIPHANHRVLYGSPLQSDVGKSCGRMIAASFLLSGGESFSSHCLHDLRPLNFLGTKEYSRLFYGCDDPFDCEFVKRSKSVNIPLQVFIAVEGSTVILFILIISVLLYFCLVHDRRGKTPKKSMALIGYDELGDDDRTTVTDVTDLDDVPPSRESFEAGDRPSFDSLRPSFDSVRPSFDSVRPSFDSVRPSFDMVRPSFDSGRPRFDLARSND